MDLHQLRDQLKAWIESDMGDDIPKNVLMQIEQQIEDNKKVTPIKSRISFWMRLFQGFKR